MPYKNILMPLTNYPARAPDNVLTAALVVAELFGGRIKAAICKITLPDLSNYLALKVTDIPGVIANARRDCDIAVEELQSAFSSVLGNSVSLPQIVTFDAFVDTHASGLMGHARLSDLIIVPIAPNQISFDLMQDLIFGSGRPVLLLPANVPAKPSFKVVVVAWDGGRVAAKAISDALPFLKSAQTVRLVEIVGDKPLDESSGVAALGRQLLSHGVEGAIDTLPADGASAGDLISAYCKNHNADLLVMGAYGHSRIRDFVLGGVTKRFVAETAIPVLLAH